MASIKDLAADIKPVVGYAKTIQFGPATLDGYMLEDGTFRQSITSTERALGAENSKVVHRLIAPRSQSSKTLLNGLEVDPLQRKMFGAVQGGNGQTGEETPIILPVRFSLPGTGGGLAYTINLAMVVETWKRIAIAGGKYAHPALELLGLSAVHSLERVYQEAFGVQDARKTEDRLIEWAIRLDAGKHFPLFGGQFHKHFARVTGVAIGHNYARTCLAELVYHRLPEPIYETLKDINQADERGWRQFSYSQLMSDEMRQQMREIVAAVTNQLANTPSKQDDPNAYRKLLHRLDKTLPRYKKRGHTSETRKLQDQNIQQ